jgi:hypothetical protein
MAPGGSPLAPMIPNSTGVALSPDDGVAVVERGKFSAPLPHNNTMIPDPPGGGAFTERLGTAFGAGGAAWVRVGLTKLDCLGYSNNQ